MDMYGLLKGIEAGDQFEFKQNVVMSGKGVKLTFKKGTLWHIRYISPENREDGTEAIYNIARLDPEMQWEHGIPARAYEFADLIDRGLIEFDNKEMNEGLDDDMQNTLDILGNMEDEYYDVIATKQNGMKIKLNKEPFGDRKSAEHKRDWSERDNKSHNRFKEGSFKVVMHTIKEGLDDDYSDEVAASLPNMKVQSLKNSLNNLLRDKKNGKKVTDYGADIDREIKRLQAKIRNSN